VVRTTRSASVDVAVPTTAVASTAVISTHPPGNIGKRSVGKADGVDPRTKATDLSRVLVAVDKGLAVVGWLGDSSVLVVVVVEAGRQLQGGSAFVVEVGNVVGEAARAVLVLAFGPVVSREGERMEGRYRGGRLGRHRGCCCGMGCDAMRFFTILS